MVVSFTVWSGVLAYQEVSSPQDRGDRNENDSLDVWSYEI